MLITIKIKLDEEKVLINQPLLSHFILLIAQSAGAVEYTDCTFAEE